jgi:hypothetical protein
MACLGVRAVTEGNAVANDYTQNTPKFKAVRWDGTNDADVMAFIQSLTTYQFQAADWYVNSDNIGVSTYDPHTYISFGISVSKNQWLVFQYYGNDPTVWWPYRAGSGLWSNVGDAQFQTQFTAV